MNPVWLAVAFLAGATAALTACADLERRLDQFFGSIDRSLYALEEM